MAMVELENMSVRSKAMASYSGGGTEWGSLTGGELILCKRYVYDFRFPVGGLYVGEEWWMSLVC